LIRAKRLSITTCTVAPTEWLVTSWAVVLVLWLAMMLRSLVWRGGCLWQI
jgi:hypothetical protein